MQGVTVVERLKELVRRGKHVDVGIGRVREFRTTQYQMIKALQQLKEEGYVISYVKLPNKRVAKILSAPGYSYSSVFKEWKLRNDQQRAKNLKAGGLSNVEIARRMKMPESSIRHLLK